MSDETSFISLTNLPDDIEHRVLLRQFSAFGEVRRIYLHPEKTFAKVYYQSLEDAQKAMSNMNGKPSNNYSMELQKEAHVSNSKGNMQTAPRRHNDNYNSSCFTEYVDIFGRAINVIRTNDGLAVALTELKNSGFELYERGTLPQPGQYRMIDEKIVDEFDKHMRAEAIRFIQQCKLSSVIKDDKITSSLEKCNNYLQTIRQGDGSPRNANSVSSSKSNTKYNQNQKREQIKSNDHSPKENGDFHTASKLSNFNNRKENITVDTEEHTPFLRRPRVDLNEIKLTPPGVNAYDSGSSKDKETTQNKETRPNKETRQTEAHQNKETPSKPQFSIDPKRLSLLLNPKAKCVIDFPQNAGNLQFINKINDEYFLAFVLPDTYTDALQEMDSITGESTDDPTYIPKIGELVAVINDDEYVRGLVTYQNPDRTFIVALIDFGVVKTDVKSVRRLPPRFSDFFEYTCMCQVAKNLMPTLEMTKEDMVPYILTSPGAISLKLGETEISAAVYRWDPFQTSLPPCPLNRMRKQEALPVRKEPTYTMPAPRQITDNEQVIIVAECDGSLYVRSRKENTDLKQVESLLNNYTGSSVTQVEVGQLILVPFDGEMRLRRATVSAVNGMKITVDYVDYGKQGTNDLKAIVNIKEEIATIGRTLLKMYLKGFSKAKFGPKQLDILNGYIESREKFTTVQQSEENVFDLKLSDGNSLSVKLISAKRQSFSTSSINKPISAVKSTVRSLPGRTMSKGEKTALVVYNGNLKNGEIAVWLYDDIVESYATQLTDVIAKCVASDSTPYHPSQDEVCLAHFSDDWHRAIVLSVADNQYRVYFVDYGNSDVVTPGNIRKFPEELWSIPKLASTCELKGLKNPNPKLIERMKELIVEEDVCAITVLSQSDNGYVITIPAVEEKLHDEKLI